MGDQRLQLVPFRCEQRFTVERRRDDLIFSGRGTVSVRTPTGDQSVYPVCSTVRNHRQTNRASRF